MPEFFHAGAVADWQDGEIRLVELDGTKIALCRQAEEFFAVADLCPHLGGQLSKGKLESGEIICPKHAWRFKLSTGRCVNVRGQKAHVFPVEIRAGRLFVGL